MANLITTWLPRLLSLALSSSGYQIYEETFSLALSSSGYQIYEETFHFSKSKNIESMENPTVMLC
jgi:hypothetical protein